MEAPQMKKSDADKIILEYVDKLYGFALNKLGDPAEAEELAAKIRGILQTQSDPQ